MPSTMGTLGVTASTTEPRQFASLATMACPQGYYTCYPWRRFPSGMGSVLRVGELDQNAVEVVGTLEK